MYGMEMYGSASIYHTYINYLNCKETLPEKFANYFASNNIIHSYGLSSLKAVYYGTIYQLHYKVQCHLGLSKLKLNSIC